MQKARALVTKPAAVFVLLALLGVTAHASAILVFTNRAAFEEVVGPPTFGINFTGLQTMTGPSSINFGAMTVAGDFVAGEDALRFSANPQTQLGINFTSNVFAWGGDFSPSGAARIDFSGGGLGTTINFSSPSFIGFVSGVPLSAFNLTVTSLERTDTGGAARVDFLIDNVVVNAVPEPVTLALLATGAGLAALAQRRRKRTTGHEDGSAGEGHSDQR
jgi:hypothetical protein